MGAGGPLGLLLGIGAGMAGASFKRKREQEDQLLKAGFEHPELWNNPGYVKAVKPFATPETLQFGQGIAAAHQKAQTALQGVYNPQQAQGGGGAAPASSQMIAGAAPKAGGQPPQGGGLDFRPQLLSKEEELKRFENFITTPDYAALSKTDRDNIKTHMEGLRQDIRGLGASERSLEIRTAFDSPAAKEAGAAAATKGRIGTELAMTPEIAKSKSTIAGAESVARTSAEESVRTSEPVVAAEERRTTRLETAKASVHEQVKAHEASGKPWTFQNGQNAYKSARSQAERELTVSKKGLFSTETIKPSNEAIETRTKRILASEGIDPTTHERMNDGDTVVFPDGSKVHWFGTRKTGAPTSAPATSTAAASGGG